MTTDNLAFLFSGQGSQTIGMLSDLAAGNTLVGDTFAEASGVLGYDLWDLCQNGEQEKINQTEITQPLMLASSTAIWRVWKDSSGPLPSMLAGHSLGEWSALVAAGVVAFSDAVSLVQKRGASMQEAVPAGEGAMAAVMGLEDEKITEICNEHGAEAVNFNSPGQVVIAGKADSVERAMVALKDAGAKRAVPLPVSAPFHTTLMKPAAEAMTPLIEATAFNAPAIPVVHNFHAATEADPDAIKQLMIKQIDHPVLWVDCVKALSAAGITTTLECGPGKVLAGLSKRIDKSLTASSLETPEAMQAALDNLS
jgi:[acyl-carrier-protein] S-malonyltransferase